jgi:hypothetical protein
MKPRNTIILLLIAIALYCYMRFYESDRPTTQEAEEQSGHVVPMIDQSKIDGITITNNETTIELRKQDNQWTMEQPVKDRADDAAVGQLLSSVNSLRKQTSLKPDNGKDEVRDFGLVKPNVRLQLLGEGAPPEILFGKDTAMEGQEYIRLGNSDEVYVVPNDLRTQVTKPADEFRDHRLSDIAATQVTKVNIKTAAGEIELQKDHDHWQINKPIKARADDAKTADVIAQALNTKVDSFVGGDQAAAAATALNDAAGSVAFVAEGVDKPLVLQISKPIDKAPQKVYAKLSARDAQLILSGSVSAILDTKPGDVRDQHLIRLDLDTVDRIHIAPAGAPEILLSRKGEDWTIKSLNDKPANSGAVQAMAGALQNQLVTAFVSDVATDLPKYGLDQPRLKVTFSSYATDNTAETKAGEEPLETILFGKVDGGNVYAKLDDEPFIVSLPKTVLDGIYTDPLKWQGLAIFNLKPADIAGMDVTGEGQATLSLVREKGTWKPAKGDIALNTANLDSMANTLAALRAAQWAGAAQPGQGLDKPAVTITFTTAAKQANTVKVGAPAGDYFSANATGFAGAFLISKADHDALTASVLPGAPPVATPAASAPAAQAEPLPPTAGPPR